MKFEDFKSVDTLYQFLHSFKLLAMNARSDCKETTETTMCLLTIVMLNSIKPIYQLENEKEYIKIYPLRPNNDLHYMYAKKNDEDVIQFETGVIENFSFENTEVV